MDKKNKRLSIGPGFLVTAAFIGPGTVTACSMAGARFGTALIYTLVFATLTTIVLQKMTGRLAIGSRHDLAQALREFPQTRLTRAVFAMLTLCAISLGCAAYEAGNIIGGSIGLEMVTSLPKRYWVLLISLTAAFVLSRRKHKIVERFLIFLVFLMSASFLATLAIIKPDISSILRGFLPTFPKNSMVLVLALIGTTVVPYNLFLHSSAVKEKWHSASDLKNVNRDLILSVSLGGIISISIVVTSAFAFFEQGIQLHTGAQLAQQLKPLFQSSANLLFGLGFFAAGLSSAMTAPYAAAFASAGVLGWKKGRNAAGFKAVWLAVILTGLVVSFFDLNPLSVIIFAQVANGIVLPVASIFLLIVLNNKEKMGGMANTVIQNIWGIFIVLIVSALGVWNILKLFVK